MDHLHSGDKALSLAIVFFACFQQTTVADLEKSKIVLAGPNTSSTKMREAFPSPEEYP